MSSPTEEQKDEEAVYSPEVKEDEKKDVVEIDKAEEEPATTTTEESKKIPSLPADAPWADRMWEVFTTFWPLGICAFGGPQAHIAILRDHLVVQRDWLDEEQFTELFAIGQGLPGPTSTQLVISTALSRAGPLGGLLAFFLWNLPGLIVLTAAAVAIDELVDPNNPPFYLIGLPPAAISLVFKAFYGFAMKLDTLGIILSLCSSCVAVLINNDEHIQPDVSQWVFPTMLAVGGIVTFVDSKRDTPFSNYKSQSKGWDADSDETMKRIGIPLWVGAGIFGVWAGVLVLSIVLANTDIENEYLEIFETMYRIGSIIFGGGQVVLPMLQDEVVPNWMTKDQFLQGLGLAQSMPGPLFNFASYLGGVYAGIPGALVGWLGLFGPGVILIFAMVPFWARLRHNPDFKAFLKGVNATAIGLVGAACIILWESAISGSADAIVFSIAFTLAVVFGVQAPICILVGGVVGAILHPKALDLGQVPYCVDQGYVLQEEISEAVQRAIAERANAWPNICKELDELPLFCCANQQGQPLAYTIEVEDDEKRNVAMLYCDPSDAELELTKINQTTKQKDNGIIPFPLGKAFELWAANQAVLVPTKASIVQAGAPSGASPVGQEIPLFACMEIMQEQQQGQSVLPLFLSSDEAHQAVDEARLTDESTENLQVVSLSLSRAVELLATVPDTPAFSFIAPQKSFDYIRDYLQEEQ